MIHFFTGILALAASRSKNPEIPDSAVRFLAIFYCILAIWGFPAVAGPFDGILFGTVHVNAASEVFHLIIGFSGFTIGYILNPRYGGNED